MNIHKPLNEMSHEELLTLAKKLQAEQNKGSRYGNLTLKVAEKSKALSIYGLQRTPVTLYASQWEKILEQADNIRTFIQENNGALVRKENQPVS